MSSKVALGIIAVLAVISGSSLPAGAGDSECWHNSSAGCAYADSAVSNLTVIASGSSGLWPTYYGHSIKIVGKKNGATFMNHTRGPANTTAWSSRSGSTACLGFTMASTSTTAWGGGYSLNAWDTSSGACDPQGSPLVVDLDRSGAIELSGKPTNFDLAGDGHHEHLADWVSGGGDGFVYDTTVTGQMSGLQLFGDQGGFYPTGYEKLALRDLDGDDRLTGSELDGLALWVDNGNARFNAKEHLTLNEVGIATISLIYDDDFKSSVVLSTGEELMLQDIFFSYRN